jgi:hypothetical protein
MEWEHDYRERWGLCAGSIFDYGLTLGYLTRRCSSGRSICYVSSDGTVFPCTTCAGAGIFAAGNVAETSFADVWGSEGSQHEGHGKRVAHPPCPFGPREFDSLARRPRQEPVGTEGSQHEGHGKRVAHPPCPFGPREFDSLARRPRQEPVGTGAAEPMPPTWGRRGSRLTQSRRPDPGSATDTPTSPGGRRLAHEGLPGASALQTGSAG